MGFVPAIWKLTWLVLLVISVLGLNALAVGLVLVITSQYAASGNVQISITP